jgi:hypothetical protein
LLVLARKILRWLCIALWLLASCEAVAIDLDDEPKWAESPVVLPSPPKDSDLLRFDVSRASRNVFYVDAASLSVGDDGVVRFTLVIESPSGVKNISYEGMRCSSAERRVYAFGEVGGGWSLARQQAWQVIRGNSLNRHYAALYSEYFCIPGREVRSASDALTVLRRGGVNITTMP